ncbi:MAG: hypothetical protein RLN89_09380 [Parvibaculum sp.]
MVDPNFPDMNAPKLDVVATVKEAYKGAWSHFGEMTKLVWAPVAIYVAINVVHASFVQNELVGIDQEDPIAMLNAAWGWQTILLILASIFLWPMIAVAWHRFILLGEVSTQTFYFRFGKREARFLLTTIFLSLLSVPGMLVIMVGGSSALAVFAVPVGLVLIVMGLLYAARLSLLLPAVATDSLTDARTILDATRGQVLSIVLVHMLNFLGIIAIAIVVNAVGQLLSLIVGAAGTAISGAVVTIFSQIISVAILSIMYRDLVLSRVPASPASDETLD